MSDPITLALSRLRPTKENLLKLISQERALPTHEAAYKDAERALNRAKIGDVTFNHGSPQLPDPSHRIFDFSEIGEYPNAFLSPYTQPISVRGIPESVKPATRASGLRSIMEEAQHGAREGRWAWYDMNPLLKFIDAEIAPENIQHAQNMLKFGAPLSQQTDVPTEIIGSTMLNYLNKKGGRDLALAEGPRSIMPLGGGASPYEKVRNAMRVGDGEDLPTTWAKLAAYHQNRSGNLYPPTLDTKTLRVMDLSPDLKPEPKGAAGALIKLLSSRTNVMPGQFQPLVWPAGKGTKGAEEPFTATLNNILRRAALMENEDPKRYAIDVLSGDRQIGFTPKQLGYSAGGIVSPLKQLLQDHLRMKEIARRNVPTYADRVSNKLQANVHTGNAWDLDPLLESPIGGRAMKANAVFEAPKEWEDSILNARIKRDALGSGRHIMIADVPGTKGNEQAIIKTAKRPRALLENAGDEGLESAGLMPKPYFLSDDQSVRIVPMQRTDPFALRAHQKLMEPLSRLYHHAVDKEQLPFPTAHIDHPILNARMRNSELAPFLEHKLLGGDFFTFKGKNFGSFGDDFKDMRVQSIMTRPQTGRGFTLLDEGAIHPDLLDAEAAQKPAFNDYVWKLSQRLRDPAFRQLMIGPEKQRDFGFADGGHIQKARDALKFDKGGAVRNWLMMGKIAKPVGYGGNDPMLASSVSNVDRMLERLDRGSPNDAIASWVNTNLRNYMLRKYPDQELADASGFGLDLLDNNIKRMTGKQFREWAESMMTAEKSGKSHDLSLPKWLKDDAEYMDVTSAYVNPLSHVGGDSMGFLRTLPPEQLPRMSVPEVVRQSRAWHEAIAKKAEAERLKKLGIFGDQNHEELIMEHPNGWRTVRITSPERLKAEGDAMGHCVGSYCSDMASGDSFFSLMGPRQGGGFEPHVTTHAVPAGPDHIPALQEIRGRSNSDAKPEYLDMLGAALFGKYPGLGLAPFSDRTVGDAFRRGNWWDKYPHKYADGGRVSDIDAALSRREDARLPAGADARHCVG